jgi:Autographiviridae endonuclease
MKSINTQKMGMMSPQERILLSSIPEPNSGCWLWLSWVNAKGYAQLRYKGRCHRANRLSFSAFVGSIPDGLHVLHRCDNPACVNPEHLFLGTNIENVRDREAKGRGARFIGSQHPRAKLTEEDVLTIRHAQLHPSDMAEQYNVSVSTIKAVKSRRNWSHI